MSESKRLRVFISWSGAKSRRVAEVWRDLVKSNFERADPFISTNVEAGARALVEIKAELDKSFFGIVVVTQSNQAARWINFETGALSKQIDEASVRVAPCLVDFEDYYQVGSPLNQFQMKMLDKQGVEEILKSICKAFTDLSWEVDKKEVFDTMWDSKWEELFEAARAPRKDDEKVNEPEQTAMIREVLSIVRTIETPTHKSAQATAEGTATATVRVHTPAVEPKPYEWFLADDEGVRTIIEQVLRFRGIEVLDFQIAREDKDPQVLVVHTDSRSIETTNEFERALDEMIGPNKSFFISVLPISTPMDSYEAP